MEARGVKVQPIDWIYPMELALSSRSLYCLWVLDVTCAPVACNGLASCAELDVWGQSGAHCRKQTEPVWSLFCQQHSVLVQCAHCQLQSGPVPGAHCHYNLVWSGLGCMLQRLASTTCIQLSLGSAWDSYYQWCHAATVLWVAGLGHVLPVALCSTESSVWDQSLG